MKIKQYKMNIFHHNQFVPWENEQAIKNKPKHFNGWFTLDELRKLNPAFSRMPEDWEPVIARSYQDHIDITWPSNPIYFVRCSEIREIEVDENAID